jgi:uncharacterized protein YggT (Ycf19 family)
MFTPIGALVSMVIGAIEFFLGLRFLFRLFGANPTAPFVSWIYEMTAPLVAPFSNIFPTPKVEGFVFDFTTLFALFVYVFIGYLVLQFIAYISLSLNRRDVP